MRKPRGEKWNRCFRNEGEHAGQALVVDNSKGLRLLLGWILQEVGIETVEASNGTEALQILGVSGHFAVVILDWDLPGMNGIQLAIEIRSAMRS